MEPIRNAVGWIEGMFENGDLSNEVSRVEKAGRKIPERKTLIAESYGDMALIIDPEGNRIAFHSKK